jgi:hypothetical protein
MRELEAEAVTFVVGKAVGLKNEKASADYIQLYQGNASLLAESLEVIQQTANVILSALEPPVEAEDSESEPPSRCACSSVTFLRAGEVDWHLGRIPHRDTGTVARHPSEARRGRHHEDAAGFHAPRR